MMEMESPRRSASPEFEFWMVGNSHPELEPSGLLTADELFVDGVLLPLHLLSIPPDPNPEPTSGFGSGSPEPPTKKDQHRHQHQHQQEEPSLEAAPAPAATASICREASICSSSPAPSKRWRDIFKVGEKKKESAEEKERKERKASNGGGGSGSGGAAELNINIWPFSRSRSAGTAAGGRPKAAAAAMRKSSSAPCSRSNSRGEKRWAASPGRPGGGVHVGRASPVWQVRRAGNAGRAAKGSRPKGGNRGLGLNVNSCIGYRNQVSCRGEGCDGGRAANNSNGRLFKFRSLFSKKVY